MLLSNYTVYTDDNYVSGEISHLSVFGLGALGGDDSGGGTTAGGSSGSSGGSGRKCFIATATFGTPMAREVRSLTYFRDTCLLTNRPGQFIIGMYEKYSPPIARIIEASRFLKGAVRYYLRPIITFARFVNVIAIRCNYAGGPKKRPWFYKEKMLADNSSVYPIVCDN